ncbi:hypothetical protein ACWGIN_16535 [Streptomyces sp. NPDC054861]
MPLTPGESADPSRTKTATADGVPPLTEDEAQDREGVPPTDGAPPSGAEESLPAAARRLGAETTSTTVDRQIPVLTMGAGLALMGLGIGFLGIRMRRR